MIIPTKVLTWNVWLDTRTKTPQSRRQRSLRVAFLRLTSCSTSPAAMSYRVACRLSPTSELQTRLGMPPLGKRSRSGSWRRYRCARPDFAAFVCTRHLRHPRQSLLSHGGVAIDALRPSPIVRHPEERQAEHAHEAAHRDARQILHAIRTASPTASAARIRSTRRSI